MAHTKEYHIFSYNRDIPSEYFLTRVPETKINKALVGICKEYYEIMNIKPKRLTKLAESTSEADTRKLIKLVKTLAIDLNQYCKNKRGCDNNTKIVNVIIKGGENMW